MTIGAFIFGLGVGMLVQWAYWSRVLGEHRSRARTLPPIDVLRLRAERHREALSAQGDEAGARSVEHALIFADAERLAAVLREEGAM